MTKKKRMLDFAKSLGSANIGTYASSIAFFFFLSMIPIIILLCALLPHLGLEQGYLTNLLTGVMPEIAESLVKKIIADAYSKSVALLPISLLALIWASSAGVLAMIRGLNVIYKAEDHRNYLVLCLVSILYTIVLLLIFLSLLFVLVFGDLIRTYVEMNFPDFPIATLTISRSRYVILLVLAVLLFALMYTFVPAGSRNFLCQIPGAGFSLIAWIIFSYFFGLYINGVNRYTSFYGSLAIPAILMFWMYCCFYIFLVGGYINSYFENTIRRYHKKLLSRKSDPESEKK